MFVSRVKEGIQASRGTVCVGLDPHLDRIPERFGASASGVREFLMWVIERTLPHACAYKPNIAFFEALGSEGLDVLREIIGRIRTEGRAVILDAKRGDIGSTAAAYAIAAFDVLRTDAITLVPYMGTDAVIPFLERGGFTFLLALPSNPSAEEIVNHGSPPLYLRVGEMAKRLAEEYPDQVGLVVGATQPELAVPLHSLAPELPWLVPGIGAQGGSAEAFFAAIPGHGVTLVSASRSIVFSADPREAARELKQRIEEVSRG